MKANEGLGIPCRPINVQLMTDWMRPGQGQGQGQGMAQAQAAQAQAQQGQEKARQLDKEARESAQKALAEAKQQLAAVTTARSEGPQRSVEQTRVAPAKGFAPGPGQHAAGTVSAGD